MTHYADPRNCKHCGTEYTPIYKKRKSVYCSLACQRAACLDTSHNAELARATATKRGDVLRGRGEGKSYPKIGGRHAHRVMAEKILGRPLLPGETVHHKDENKQNYSRDNLEIVSGQEEHARHHSTGRPWKCNKVRPIKICSVDECGRPSRARGMCTLHYQRWKKGR